MPPRLLVLSNGHGEDLIALRVIEALARRQPGVSIAVLPLVGEGSAFSTLSPCLELERLGPSGLLPSGGFSNQSLRGLLQDLAAGLPSTTLQQLHEVRRWGGRGRPILAIGDLLPLVLAWLGGGPFGFIGTPKSDYTWRSPSPPGWGSSPLSDAYHRCKGSEWDPWEWALMAHPRCRLVAVRDRLTARGLRSHRVRALAPGNPMMDGFEIRELPECLIRSRRVMLLPGSRLPEALGNFSRLVTCLPDPDQCERLGGVTVLVPVGRGLHDSRAVAEFLQEADFHPLRPAPEGGAQAAWRRGSLQLWLGLGTFMAWAPWSEVGLATAGTATEQLVGLGLPALSLPGSGPQFKAGFARRQSRLLGGAVQPFRKPGELRARLLILLEHSRLRELLGRKGRQRMGPPGGSDALAGLIVDRLLRSNGMTPPRGDDANGSFG